MTGQASILAAVERKNLALNVVEGGLYISTTAFVSFQTVLPAFVTRLGGTNLEVGLVGVITYFAAVLPQLFAARFVETLPWKKPWAVRFGIVQRTCVLLIGFATLLYGFVSPGILLWIFLLLYLMNQTVAGITSVGWFDFFVKITSPKKRGRLIGYRNSLGGFGAFLCSFRTGIRSHSVLPPRFSSHRLSFRERWWNWNRVRRSPTVPCFLSCGICAGSCGQTGISAGSLLPLRS